MKEGERNLKNFRVFNRKKSNLDKRVKDEYLDHGIATIPCRVDGMNDIISSYSVPGYESLDDGFVEYVSGIVEAIPTNYPIVLNIVGTEFSPKEQETIKSTIEDDLAYALGAVERENRYHIILFICMIIGLIVTTILLSVFGKYDTIPVEFLFVFFWFFADTFVAYLLIDGRNLRQNRIRAARLACMTVVFSQEYDERDYSEGEAEEFFDHLYKESKEEAEKKN